MACSNQRSVYLITYSRADLQKISTREEFADVWVKAFGEEIVKQWACCCEKHKENEEVHYHLALKLKRVKRWKMARDHVIKNTGIVCHFQEFHTNYYDAFSYVKKEDADYVMSEGHPMLNNSPPTKKASAKRISITCAADLREKSPPRPKKKKTEKLDNLKVYEIIINNKLQTERDLFVLANTQKQEGKTDLLDFLLRMSDKRRAELLRTAWRVHNSTTESERNRKTAIELLMEKGTNGNCVCDGEYRKCAVDILNKNDVDIPEFKRTVFDALSGGRKKGNNVLIIGPANCGKTFLLRPLTEVFKCFVSPASGTFAWVGAEKAEVVFLNDLRWNEKLITWGDFLNLLEGLPIHIQAPKTHFAEDILWSKRTPIFATSSNRIRKYDGGVINETETGMMEVRWKYFQLSKPILNPKEIKPCGFCFANFLLTASDF